MRGDIKRWSQNPLERKLLKSEVKEKEKINELWRFSGNLSYDSQSLWA
jgi:hypothetical protein